MPPTEENFQGQTPGTPPAGTPPIEGDDPALGSIALTPEHVRNTPEYRELQRQNRILAREKGNAEAQAAAVRAQAEQAAQAAEAERVAAQEAQVRAMLGEEGVAFWDQFSDLSNTDPIKAAALLAEFTKGRAQSQPPVTPEATPPAAGGTEVTGQQQPPATGLSRSVGDAPIVGQGDSPEAVIAGLEKRYQDVVERNLDPATRNRVTMRDRASAMISYLGAAYMKSGAKPK